MGKKTAIGIGTLVGLAVTSVFLYSHFIGFERNSLAAKIPDDAYSYLSIRHLRKAGLAFATDDQLKSAFKVVEAIAKIIDDSSSAPIFPTTSADVDKELVTELARHFKTQLALVVLPSPKPEESIADFALLADFYGDAGTFASTLHEIALQASTPEVSYHWNLKETEGVPYQQLSIKSAIPQTVYPCWSIYDDTLYLCSSANSLQKLLRHAQFEASESIEPQIGRHHLEAYLDAPDLTVYVNNRPSLQLLASRFEKELIKQGGLMASLKPQTLVEELGLNEIESILLSTSLSGSKRAYAGIAFKTQKGLLSAIRPVGDTAPHPRETASISAFETLNIDSGHLLLTVKDAILKAAPISNFAYYGIKTKVLSATGSQLEDILENAFHGQASFQQTIDIATARNADHAIGEQIVHDYAFRFSLREGQLLTRLIEGQIPSLIESSPRRIYKEGNTLHIDGDIDASVTANRFALSYDEESLTLGYGTLKSFDMLKNSDLSYIRNLSQPSTDIDAVGSGSLSLQSLPTTLFQYAMVFYRQLNPDRPIPEEFLKADWGALTALEQERTSTTYLATNGRLFRVSELRPEN